MPRFALTGCSGYVAPRHLRAIRDVGGELVAALDPHDSAGVLDAHFPDAAFFTEFERFDRHLDRLRRDGRGIDYLVVCAPNHVHDSHCRLALRLGADAICEKPLVLNPWNLDALAALEQETGRRVWTILQLRVHPEVLALRERVTAAPATHRHVVRLVYVTPRGPWYRRSWKGDPERSGGILTNIGIHLFDLLLWVFGPVAGHARVDSVAEDRVVGHLALARADVEWTLSTRREDAQDGGGALRTLAVDGEGFDFSTGFTDLHTRVYRETLAGGGFGIADARPAVELVARLRGSAADAWGEDDLVRLAAGVGHDLR